MNHLKQREVKNWQLTNKHDVSGYWDYDAGWTRVYKLNTRLGNFMFSRTYRDEPTLEDRESLVSEAIERKQQKRITNEKAR